MEEFMQNRELSWLKFNQRVLEEASDESVPPLERFKFISIFTSNLDEFFMVRVGSLFDLMKSKKEFIDKKSGMTAKEQLDAIYKTMPYYYEMKDKIYKDVIKELDKYNMHNKNMKSLNDEELSYVKSFYLSKIEPLISAQIVDAAHPLPFLENKKLYIVTEMWDAEGNIAHGLVAISDIFERYLSLPGDEFNYIRVEKVIEHYVPTMFLGYTIKEQSLVAVTRNFDFETNTEIEEEIADYKDFMKKVIKKRTRQEVLRLEISNTKSKSITDFLKTELGITDEMILVTKSPINMKYVYGLEDIIPSSVIKKVSYEDFTPFKKYSLERGSIIKRIEEKDLLLSYPYDDIDTFLDLIKEAAESDKTISIKITIYRLAKHSKLVEYLKKACDNGIEVTALMELKARFDEENNINYSEELFKAGCNIMYGFEEYKTHSKLCLITYKDDRENIKYITQIGTGNYNENTSKIYTDFSLMTSNEEIGLDANDFFRNMSLAKLNGKYLHLLQSPSTLKARLLKEMDKEIAKGKDGYIRCKMNSLTDYEFLEKFAEASQNSVNVDLIIRGICCIVPNVTGYTDNVHVSSIVGRFLEHSRVYQFGRGSDMRIYISSADLMTRNTEKRVEIACPVYDEEARARLVSYLDIQLKDNIKRRILVNSGDYIKPEVQGEALIAQDYFMHKANEKREKFYEELERAELDEAPKENFFTKIKKIFTK